MAAAGVLAGEVVVGATTTVAIQDSRANRAGSFRTHCVRRRKMLAGDELEIFGGQEADQHLQSARRNTHGSRDNGTKQSAGINENSRRVSVAEIRLQEGESLENALRRFKRKVQSEDIFREVKRHSYYLKPGERRRAKQALARKRARKKIRKEGSFAKDSRRE